MRLDKALPDSVSLFHDDYEWTQSLDYEHVPFCCRKCHAHGNLFCGCLLNAKPQSPDPSEKSAQDGFTKVANRKILHKKSSTGKKPQEDVASFPSTSNSFEILAKTSEDHPLNLMPIPSPITSPEIPPPSGSSPTPRPPKYELGAPEDARKNSDWKPNDMDVDGFPNHSLSLAITSEDNSQTQQMDEEPESIDLGGLDILELKQACKKKDYDNILKHQLSTLEVIISRAYQQQQLGIQPGSHWDGGFLPKDSKRGGEEQTSNEQS